jgi:hypothetical protein
MHVIEAENPRRVYSAKIVVLRRTMKEVATVDEISPEAKWASPIGILNLLMALFLSSCSRGSDLL